MPKKTINPERAERKAEAKKLKHWAFSNFSIMASSGMIPLEQIPDWANMIRQARMLEEINAIWLATEVLLRRQLPGIKTEASKAEYDRGLKNLIKLSMSGQTSSAGGA